MAKRNRTGIWLVVASVAVLAFVGVLFLADMGSEESSSDITPDMTLEAALETTRSSCYGATGEWRAAMNKGADAAAEARRLSRRCEENATRTLDGIPAEQWANPHCRAYIEGFRDLARWEIEYADDIANPGDGAVAADLAQKWRRAEVLMGTVRYQYDRCIQQGVVG